MCTTNTNFFVLRIEKSRRQSVLTPVGLQQERQRAANIALHPDHSSWTTSARPTPDGGGQGVYTGQE